MPAAAASKMRVGRRGGEKGAGEKGDKAGLTASAKRTRPVTMKGRADVAAAPANAPAARPLAKQRAASRLAARMDELAEHFLQLRGEFIQQRDELLQQRDENLQQRLEIQTLKRALLSWGAMSDQLAKAALKQKVKIGTLEVTVGQLILALDTIKRDPEEKCGDGAGGPAGDGRGPKTPPGGMSSLGELVNVVGVPAQQLSSLTDYLARGEEMAKSNNDQQQPQPVAVVVSASPAPASEFLRLSPTNRQSTEGALTGGAAMGTSEGSPARQVSGMEGAGESDGGTITAKSAVRADSSSEETRLRLATSQSKMGGSEVFPGIVAMEPILDAIDADKRAAGNTDIFARRRGFALSLDIPPTAPIEGEEEGGAPAGEDKTESDVAALTMMALQKSLLVGVGPKPSLSSGSARPRPGGAKTAGKPPRPPTSPGAISTLRVIFPSANGGGDGPVRSRRGMQCRTLGPRRTAPWQDFPREAPTKQEGKATEDAAAPKQEKDRESGQQLCTLGGPRATGTGPEAQAGKRRQVAPPGSTRKYKRTKTAGGGAPVIAGGEGGAFQVVKPTPVHHSKQYRPLLCGSDSRYQIYWCATPGVPPVQAAPVGDLTGPADAINLTASE